MRHLGRNVAFGLACAISALAATGAHAAGAESSPIAVDGTTQWTPAGMVEAGDTVTIAASGTMHLGADARLVSATPAGVPWGPECAAIETGENSTWTASGLPCWSLIARVGEEPPIAIGSGASFVVERDGALALGVNDDYFGDNTGAWSADVTVESPVPAQAPAGPPAEAGTADSGSDGFNPLLIVIAAAIAIGLGQLVVIGLRKRRRRDRAAAAVVDLTEEPDIVLPDVEDELDVNIFEVTIVEGSALRVGYNYFPDGTTVRWRVARNGTERSDGEFVTIGGGSTYHYALMKLEPVLSSDAGAVEVDFDWNIGGVPFNYSVRREVNA